jgi:phosphatidylserine synthase
MNLPNSITLIRVVLIPFFINLMIYGYYRAALAVFVVACITDALDGMIARLMKSKTDLGAFLDPMADKLLIVSAFVTLVLLKMLPVMACDHRHQQGCDLVSAASSYILCSTISRSSRLSLESSRPSCNCCV